MYKRLIYICQKYSIDIPIVYKELEHYIVRHVTALGLNRKLSKAVSIAFCLTCAFHVQVNTAYSHLKKLISLKIKREKTHFNYTCSTIYLTHHHPFLNCCSFCLRHYSVPQWVYLTGICVVN